jgi:hypothetical protein
MELCQTAEVLYFLHGILQERDAEFRFGKMQKAVLSCLQVVMMFAFTLSHISHIKYNLPYSRSIVVL